MAARRLLLAGVLALAAWAPTVFGQTLPPTPVPVAPPPGPVLGRPVPFTEAPPPPPPPPPASPFAAPTADPGPGGWGPYGPPSAAEGPFFTAEIQLVKPALKNRLRNDTPLVNGAILQVPSTPLDWTVSPLFELGYRLADSAGEFTFGYRFLNSEGNAQVDGPDGPFDLRSRLALNVFDLDYGTGFYSPAPRYDIAWRIGARLADVFFDSRLSQGDFSQQASNNFIGAGPHARLDVERRLDLLPSVALFGRLDGAVLVGQVQQRFREQVGGDGFVLTDTLTVRRTQSVPVFNVQAGLSYTPRGFKNLRFTTGYTYERYWYVGRIGLQDDGSLTGSRGEVWSQGWFLRGQLDF